MKKVSGIFNFLLLGLVAASHGVDFPDRLAKATATTFPYNMVGQLYFDSGGRSYIGSGTVVRAKSILTAGHNLYDPREGWSTEILFRRAAYGNTFKGENYARRLYLLGGYKQTAKQYGSSSARTFASDTGGARFGVLLAKGASAGWSTNTSQLTNSAVYKLALGYGAEGTHSGDYPLVVNPDKAFYSEYQTFYESSGAYFEGGMSGGPIFVSDSKGNLSVMGVIVSGSDFPYVSGGIRILDATVSTFIQGYLR
jgi:hypothetical protein